MTTKELYKIFLRYPQICTDSRKITPGCLFFALRGESFNGNTFAIEAVRSGAAFSVVDDPDLKGKEQCILVEDVMASLQDLAREHRRNLKIPVLALTGTNGKTTTKELITSVLNQKFQVNSTKGNLNNHIGVPLTILETRPDHEILVVEMGANHPGEIAFLCDIARPVIGLITNIGKAHLEGFGSFEGVKRTKGELFEFIRGSGGSWIRNADDPILTEVCGEYPSLTYGATHGVQVSGAIFGSGKTLSARITMPGCPDFQVESSLTGEYNLFNILAAVSVGYHFGLKPESIAKGIEGYKPSNMRSQWVQTDRNSVLLDAYNANPSSMVLALRHFRSLNLPGKVLILGDMFELGADSRQEHEEILRLIGELGFDQVYLAGREFKALHGNLPFHFFETTEQLIEKLKQNPLSGNQILVKGSRGMKLERVLDYL